MASLRVSFHLHTQSFHDHVLTICASLFSSFVSLNESTVPPILFAFNENPHDANARRRRRTQRVLNREQRVRLEISIRLSMVRRSYHREKRNLISSSLPRRRRRRRRRRVDLYLVSLRFQNQHERDPITEQTRRDQSPGRRGRSDAIVRHASYFYLSRSRVLLLLLLLLLCDLRFSLSLSYAYF